MRGARLVAVAAERPSRVVHNDDLPASLGTSDAWIRTRTGIRSRHVAGDGESVVDMATAAGAKALAQAGVAAVDVDLLVLATCTMPSPMPAGATEVAARLGTTGGAFDLNAACAGFCYALGLAADTVRSGSAERVLVIGAERMTDLLDWNDRSTCVLFGDGAGAVLVAACEQDEISPVVWGSDGTGHDLLHVPEHGGYLEMAGPAVFRWATSMVVDVATRICARAGIDPRDLAAFVPHQANLRIVDAAARQLGLGPDTVIADDVTRTGNTSAASIPMALARLADEQRIGPGDLVLILGFGAGLSWAGQLVRCP